MRPLVQINDEVREMNDEELAAYEAAQAEAVAQAPILKAAEVRNERNRLLAESDWTQVADAPADKAAWSTYRQALRDITTQEGFPSSVTYPEKP